MAKLTKRPDGRYQRRVTLPSGKSQMVYGRTLAELHNAEDAVRAQSAAGLVVGDHTLVGEWAKQWLHTYKAGLRAGTIAMYKLAYNAHIMPLLGTMELQDVRQVHAKQVMVSVANLSESTQKKVLLTMRQIFETAIENNLMGKNPAAKLKITKHAAPDKKKYLSDDEADQLIELVTEPRAKLFCALCLYCGLRREEALGLQWADIGDDRLTVNRAVTFVGNQADDNHELKNKSSHRTIPIPDKLQAVLDVSPRLGAYLVPNVDGDMITRVGYTKMWYKHVADVVPFALHPHMLRHTYATTLYHAGIDMRTAQLLLGHSTIQMTANIYTHLESEDAMLAAEKINQQFSHKPKVEVKSSQKVVKTESA